MCLRPKESVSICSPERIGRGGRGGIDSDGGAIVAVSVVVLATVVLVVIRSLHDRGYLDGVVAGGRDKEGEDDVFCCISSSRRR